MEYKLEIKQIVDYPRCRLYRDLIRKLMADRNIRTGGSSGLFYYVILCSYANFRTSYRRVDGVSYNILPGEWLCSVKELAEWFRMRFQHQALAIMDDLQKRHVITYILVGHGKLIKYKIIGWEKHNRILDYNAPCQKDTGFFFLSVSTANELISSGKASELDVMIDLWVNTVYNDKNVECSEDAPVVYIRNGSGSPLTGYTELSKRWGVSKSTAGRYLNKLDALGHIAVISFSGTHGSVIYLQNYLSTMFQIADVMVDKDEIAMKLNINIKLPENISAGEIESEIKEKTEAEIEEEIAAETDVGFVSKNIFSVSKPYIEILLENIRKILLTQGFCCFSCRQLEYKLLPLSYDCRGINLNDVSNRKAEPLTFILVLSCKGKDIFRFNVKLQEGSRNEE